MSRSAYVSLSAVRRKGKRCPPDRRPWVTIVLGVAALAALLASVVLAP
ncbi:MAG TPA: hypothetical protein VN853_08240 [Polyangia bacterium]|nr:hypothetical protein [Polyangia bacterium]